MKTDIHPDNYRLVVFEDLNNQESFLTKSTAQTKETIKWTDGKTYPLVKVHISSASHPFYTNQEKVIDIEGRIDKFKARLKVAQANKEKLQAKAELQAKQAKPQKKTGQKKSEQLDQTKKPQESNQAPAKKPRKDQASKAKE